MSVAAQIEKIKKDKYYLISIIVQNNPESIIENLNNAGYNVMTNDPETLFMFVDNELQIDPKRAYEIMNVPVNWDLLPEDIAQALKEIKN